MVFRFSEWRYLQMSSMWYCFVPIMTTSVSPSPVTHILLHFTFLLLHSPLPHPFFTPLTTPLTYSIFPPFSQSHLIPTLPTSPSSHPASSSPNPTQFYLHSWDSSKGILPSLSIDWVILVWLLVFFLPLFCALICFQIFLSVLFFFFFPFPTPHHKPIHY